MRRDFETVCDFGRDPSGGWTRPAYGPDECKAHDWLASEAQAAGATVRQDAAGNLIARLAGRSHDRPAIAIGSHLDTVRQGGAFDGVIGVLAGLEILRRCAVSGGLNHPLELIAFRDEEGRFGALTGSRAMTGALGSADPARMRDADGQTLASALRNAGLDPDALSNAARPSADFAAFFELHIEQGRVLEQSQVPIGLVTAIAGQERSSVRFQGQPDHAGATPMDQRRDAFAAAARFADRFRDLVLQSGGGQARGTIGLIKLFPGQANVVPGEVRLALEIRDIDADRLVMLAEKTDALAIATASQMHVEASVRRRYSEAPTPMDDELRSVLSRAADQADHLAMGLLSGANHDAGIMAAAGVRTAMLFVPSRDGLSHCPQEHTEWAHVRAARQVLEQAVRDLDAALGHQSTPETKPR